MCGPSQKIGNVGQVANLPKTRQIDNLPHVGMLHIYAERRAGRWGLSADCLEQLGEACRLQPAGRPARPAAIA